MGVSVDLSFCAIYRLCNNLARQRFTFMTKIEQGFLRDKSIAERRD